MGFSESFLFAKRHSITLSDGRTLSFRDSRNSTNDNDNSNNKKQPAILLLHGFPASSHDAHLWALAAARHNTRLIAPDRPGIGGSAFLAARTIRSYAADILALTNHLQLARFDILAVAGGSPYALACARGLPPGRVGGLAIVSGIFPLHGLGGVEDMRLGGRVALGVAAWAPAAVVAWLVDWMIGRTARDDDGAALEALFVREARARPAVDRACVEGDAGFRRAVTRSIRGAFEQAGGWGVAWEAKLLGSRWGFDLEDVPALEKGITIYQGSLDDACPVSMACLAASRLANAKLVVGYGEGHLSILHSGAEKIVGALVLGDADVSTFGEHGTD